MLDWKGRARYYFAWFLVLAIEFTSASLTMIYASTFGNDETKTYLLTWCLSLGQMWFVIEPLEVLLLVMAPSLCENDTVTKLRTAWKEIFG